MGMASLEVLAASKDIEATYARDDELPNDIYRQGVYSHSRTVSLLFRAYPEAVAVSLYPAVTGVFRVVKIYFADRAILVQHCE